MFLNHLLIFSVCAHYHIHLVYIHNPLCHLKVNSLQNQLCHLFALSGTGVHPHMKSRSQPPGHLLNLGTIGQWFKQEMLAIEEIPIPSVFEIWPWYTTYIPFPPYTNMNNIRHTTDLAFLSLTVSDICGHFLQHSD